MAALYAMDTPPRVNHLTPRHHTTQARNAIDDGEPVETGSPVCVSPPSWAATRKGTIVSLAWLATYRKLPVGSNSMARGVLPPVGNHRPPCSVPFASSIANTPTLSCPRLDT